MSRLFSTQTLLLSTVLGSGLLGCQSDPFPNRDFAPSIGISKAAAQQLSPKSAADFLTEDPANIPPDLTAVTLQQRLVASDMGPGHQFGSAVASEGDMLLVGAPRTNLPSRLAAGAVYVFLRVHNDWQEQQKLVASDAASQDGFGSVVALSGNIAVVGARYATVSGKLNAGTAYVFTRNGNKWSEQQKLTAGDASPGDSFATALGVSGDTILIGSRYAPHSMQANVGAAYVFTQTGAEWHEQQKLAPTDGADEDYFGSAVALSGDTALIGSPYSDLWGKPDTGAVYVYSRTGEKWREVQRLTASDASPGERFGCAVSLSGDNALIGSIGGDFVGKNGQRASYPFMRKDGSFAEQPKLVIANGTSDCVSGSLAISGSIAIVGAGSLDADRRGTTGFAFPFVNSSQGFGERIKVSSSDAAALDSFGTAVAINGTTLIVGAPHISLASLPAAGAVYLYRLSSQ